MTELEAIKARHSVRQYKDKKIEIEKIEKLNQVISECNEEGDLHFQLLEDAGATFNKLLNRAMGLGSAPSVIACVGKQTENLEEKIGYYGQRIVLAAQQLGLNTCWAGTYNPKNVLAKIEENEKLVIVIALGYGETQGKERKSRTFEQVVETTSEVPEWFKVGVEMALLAPTAVNQQKFEIKLLEDGTVSFIDKGGIHSKTDLGIVKYNFEVGARSIN